MKKISQLFAFFLILSLTSCDPPVTFTEPQPADISSLNQFPKKITGSYESSVDHSILNISETSVIRNYDQSVNMAINDLDSTVLLKNDSIYDLTLSMGFPVRVYGDSINYHFRYSDTLFIISAENVLKKYKGYFFMNTQQKQGWEVKRLNLSRGRLFLGSISKKEDIEILKALSESTLDTVPYQFSPTRKQFKKFIRQRGFSEQEVFVKLKTR